MTQPFQPSEDLVRLKSAVDSGYYKIESRGEEDTPIPWAGKKCSDCPFFRAGVCRVQAKAISGDAHTCHFFDEGNHEEAKAIIENNTENARREWWGKFGSPWWT